MIFDLDLGVKVIRNVAQYPLHHMTYSATKFEFATSKGLGGDAFTKKNQFLTFDLVLGVQVTRNFAQYLLHHVAYSATKFEFATSKGLGGDAFTKKIHYLTFDLGVKVTRNVANSPFIM